MGEEEQQTFTEGSKRAPQGQALGRLIRKSYRHTELLLFQCSQLSRCCLFSSMVWEVAPKPLSPPLWTPECIRPRLLMKMKMRMKSHLLLVGGNGASLRGEGLVEIRSRSLNNPTEPLLHFTYSCPNIVHVCILLLSRFHPTSSPPLVKCHQKGPGENRGQQKSTHPSARAAGRNVPGRTGRW